MLKMLPKYLAKIKLPPYIRMEKFCSAVEMRLCERKVQNSGVDPESMGGNTTNCGDNAATHTKTVEKQRCATLFERAVMNRKRVQPR